MKTKYAAGMRLTSALRESQYGTPQPTVTLEAPRGTPHRVVSACLHRLAAALDRVLVSKRRYELGDVDIPYARDGTSPTYALRFRGTSSPGTWLLVCGGTGQWQEIEDDGELEAILELLEAGADAD